MFTRIFWILAFFVGLTAILFKPVFSGKIPTPSDVLVGAYYPWLDYKWGYPVGVTYKNTSLSDVFSQTLPWRLLAVDQLKSGHFPLWNPYSFSGTPLLANWQSAPFYPGNILIFIFGPAIGWTLLLMFQPILSLIFMYLYLRILRLRWLPAVAGAVTFAFSGFMLTYLEYGTTGQIVMWLPLILVCLEKYFFIPNPRYLLSAVFLFFPVFTGGFFQPAAYVVLVSGLYYLFRSKAPLLRRGLVLTALVVAGIGSAAVQLLPAGELLGLSIRNFDHNIIEHAFGLLPVKNLVTLLSPDFFGNPVTGNFWGFMGYQETTGYFGIIGCALVILAIFSSPRKFPRNFFTGLLLASLVLAFRNPLSRLVYEFRLPLFSTGYASRWLIVTAFSASVLAGLGFDRWSEKLSRLVRPLLLLFAILGGLVIGLYLVHQQLALLPEYSIFKVGWRNTLVPLLLITLTLPLAIFLRFWRFAQYLLLVLICLDLLRFAVKFTPFSPAGFIAPRTPVTDFLQSNLPPHRLEQENIALPPNSWIYYRLSSPSGYDPLYPLSYSQFYKIYSGEIPASPLTHDSSSFYSRYADTKNFDSPMLSLAGVKYLVAVKRTPRDEIRPEGTKFDYRIPTEKFRPVFSDQSTVVLENKEVLPRAKLYDDFQVVADSVAALNLLGSGFDFRNSLIISRPVSGQLQLSPTDTAEIISYTPNRVIIRTTTQNPTLLFLSDTNYPGWRVTIDDKPTTIISAFSVFRAVELPAGNHQVIFSFRPLSFTIGLGITVFSLLILTGLWLKYRPA